jgi:hypothetical protein
MIFGAISLFKNAIAFSTPLPKYLLPPSRSSDASNAPVEAPLGTAARACVPSSHSISTSTVGFPRESRISRAPNAWIIATYVSSEFYSFSPTSTLKSHWFKHSF